MRPAAASPAHGTPRDRHPSARPNPRPAGLHVRSLRRKWHGRVDLPGCFLPPASLTAPRLRCRWWRTETYPMQEQSMRTARASQTRGPMLPSQGGRQGRRQVAYASPKSFVIDRPVSFARVMGLAWVHCRHASKRMHERCAPVRGGQNARLRSTSGMTKRLRVSPATGLDVSFPAACQVPRSASASASAASARAPAGAGPACPPGERHRWAA